MVARDQKLVRVLVADDSLECLRALSAVVSATPGFEVVGIESSGLGLGSVVSLVRPHLVLLDVLLGDQDGRELARQLRRHNPDLVVVLVSATPWMPESDSLLEIEDKRDVSPKWLADLWQRRRRGRPT